MIGLETFADLAGIDLGELKDKPTTLTPGQKEASTTLWTSADGRTRIGVWECNTGNFTGDRTAAAEYCHIIKGRAKLSNEDGSGTREVGPGDLLILPQGWKGSWEILEDMRKLFIIATGAES